MTGLTEDFTIEPATWRDLNALRVLEKACFPQDAWPLIDLIGVLSFPNILRLKATRVGMMVGFIAADVKLKEHMAWIATIGVMPEQRGQGVGKTLLDACEAQLPRAVDTIRLSVRASNQPAIQLYQGAGYRQMGNWPRYYEDGESALVMEKIR
jgi:ribosomal protein S18 acetylase RimI-like enzyme